MKRATACAYCARPRGRRPSPTAAARRSTSISRRSAVTLLCLRLALWLYREPDRNADAALPADLVAEMAGLRRDSALA